MARMSASFKMFSGTGHRLAGPMDKEPPQEVPSSPLVRSPMATGVFDTLLPEVAAASGAAVPLSGHMFLRANPDDEILDDVYRNIQRIENVQTMVMSLSMRLDPDSVTAKIGEELSACIQNNIRSLSYLDNKCKQCPNDADHYQEVYATSVLLTKEIEERYVSLKRLCAPFVRPDPELEVVVIESDLVLAASGASVGKRRRIASPKRRITEKSKHEKHMNFIVLGDGESENEEHHSFN